MIHKSFAENAKKILKPDPFIIGLAVGGSWLNDEIDEFSDLDLVLVTKEKISHDKAKMLEIAQSLGNFISGFTGEHVGEPRVLICLYDKPLLHVDIKFVTLEELEDRVENPAIIFDKSGKMKKIFKLSPAKFPKPDYQWIEDRFWTWIHYGLLKIGRGEYMEALDFLAYLRMVVFGPLLHIKNGNLPRAVRKVETELEIDDFEDLKMTLSNYGRPSLLKSFRQAVNLYRGLRKSLYDKRIHLNKLAEKSVMEYFEHIEKRKS